MSKDSRIPVRVTEDEKKKANYIKDKLNKNISEILRDYINDLYALLVPASEVNFEKIICDLKKEKENAKDAFTGFTIQSKISVLEQLKKDYEN